MKANTKWQQKYIKEETLKIEHDRQQEQVIDDVVDLLYKVAYEKFIIDKSLKNVKHFEQPNVEDVYKIIADDHEYTSKITRIGYNRFICQGCDNIIYGDTINKKLEYKYTGYLSNTDKFYVLLGVIAITSITGCIIYGFYNFILWLFNLG